MKHNNIGSSPFANNTSVGNSSQLTSSYSVVGKPGTFMDLPVSSLKSILGQRITSEKKAKQFLKKAGGFDWSLYSPILVARLKTSEGSYVYYVYDGDHRRLMFMMVFGEEGNIPCYVIDFKTTREVAERFNQINARRRTSVTKEQQFVCDYFAENAEVQDLCQVLMSVGLRVADDCKLPGDGLHEVPLLSDDPAISANALRQCVKVSDGTPAFSKAAILLKQCFPKDRELLSELIQSLTLFLKTYESSFANTRIRRVKDPFAQFSTFFKTVASTKENQRDLANQWKFEGGRIHHKEKECTALGILEGFLQSPQGRMLKTHFRRDKLEKLI